MKNKILPLFLIFTLFSALFVNFSYAHVSYIEDDVLDSIVSYCKNTDYYQTGDYYLVIAPSRSTVSTNSPYAAVLLPKYTDDTFNYYYLIESTENNHYCCTTNQTSTITKLSFPFYFFDIDGNLYSGSSVHNASSVIFGNFSTPFFYSEVDIYTNYSCTEIFFQRTPTSLVEVLEVVAPAKMFQTMMSGMIPYLIVFVIGLVAFWKAWQLLSRELRKG